MFSTFTSNVNKWLGAVEPDDDATESCVYEEKEGVLSSTEQLTTVQKQPPFNNTDNSDNNTSTDEQSAKDDNVTDDTTSNTLNQIQFDIDEVSAKAVETAKEWGNYLYGFGKTLTTEAVKTAKQIKCTVEEKTIVGDFARHQNEFVNEKQEQRKLKDAAVPPWIGYNEEESMKSQIRALSSDKRNFLRNPPAGVDFYFDFDTSHPVAMAMLQDDPVLEKMRFELVPKNIKEEDFWRNYFYRVSLIKQSTQLTSLAKETGIVDVPSRSSSSKSLDNMAKENVNEAEMSHAAEPDELEVGGGEHDEFASDAFAASCVDEEDIKKEMQQLAMADQTEHGTDRLTSAMDRCSEVLKKADNIPEWERELQAELQEYEVVVDGIGIDDDLEQEILKEIESESNAQV